MYRILSLVLCLILAGCNDDGGVWPDFSTAQVNAPEPAVQLVQAAPAIPAPPVIESPSEGSQLDDVVILDDVVMPVEETFPVLVFSYLASYFDPYQSAEYASDMQRFHRAQVYSPFADRSLDWFGEQKSHEYETVVGLFTEWDEVPDYDADILRDANGNRLYFNFACTGSKCTP